MRIGILGPGMVGTAIGGALVQRGEQVMMGSRSTDNPKAVAWARSAGSAATHGTLADAARFGEIVFHCTAGGASVDALLAAGGENLAARFW